MFNGLAEAVIHPHTGRMQRVTATDLRGKIIDIHAHAGISVKAYANNEYPYAQSVEDLVYRHRANGVDAGVAFPFAPELHFNLPELIRSGVLAPTAAPISRAPYSTENRVLMEEVGEFGFGTRILPFACIHPETAVNEQLEELRNLTTSFPFYGIKVSPVLSQAPVLGLLGPGKPLLDFAAELDVPVIVHVTVDPLERFSQVADALTVTRARPEIRFCLAHCAAFHRAYLEVAGELENVWVDTSALTIQTEATFRNLRIMATPEERLEADYSDHKSVMRSICERFSDTMVWGSDSPAYTYISRRLQGDGSYFDFRLKATYEDEKAALDALESDIRFEIGSNNAIRLLFGVKT